MSNEQYRDGTVSVANASAVWIGSGTDWLNQLSLPVVVKIDADNESTYSVATIVSATRLHTSANYGGTTGSGLDYMAMRSWTTNRGWWRPLQGDNDFAEILSQETIDKIDEDVAHIMSGNATIDGTTNTSFGIDTDGNTLRIKSTNLTASRYYHFPNSNASIPSGADVIRANASVAKNASDIVRANASIDILQADMVRANASIDVLQSDVVNANASITKNISGIANANASIETNASNIVVANASIDAIQTIVVSNPQLKTSDYQILTTDNMILASGNVIITLASASAKHEIRIGNRSLDANASAHVKKSGGDTVENNASLNLNNKYDTVCLVGDGANTHFQF